MPSLCSSRIVRSKELCVRLGGISRVNLWRWERQGRIPKKRRIGPNICGWLESEVEDWFASTDLVGQDAPSAGREGCS